MSSGIEARIRTVIASTLHVDERMINRSASIADHLGADSLDFVTLILAIEDEFHVDVHDEDAAELVTVGQLIDYIELGTAITELSASEVMRSAGHVGRRDGSAPAEESIARQDSSRELESSR